MRWWQVVTMLTAFWWSATRAKALDPDQSTATDSILIRNVFMVSQEDTTGLKVTVLMVDKRLELVTKDDIPQAPGAITYNGQGGFLVGKLVLGQPPSFVILRENPLQRFDILLNTKEYLLFAVDHGEIVTNKLGAVTPNPSGERKARLTWTAYNPPPMAVPFNYYSKRKWNKFSTKYVSGLFNGILALDRLQWLSQDTDSKGQVGELKESSLGEIRAIRFGVVGTFNFRKPWIYTFFVTNNTFDRDYISGEDNKLHIYDLRVDIPLPGKITMSVGKQKEPISMERLVTLVFLPMQERQAAADAFLTARNYGIVFNSQLLKNRGTWAIGAFRNWIDSDTTFRNTATQITGRITGVPFVTKDESNLLHLGLGVRYSDARQPFAGKTEAEFYLAPVFVDTKEIQADRLLTYDLELYWRKGPLLLGSEYIFNNIKASALGNPAPSGYNISGTWAITGEMHPYRKRSGIFDPLPVSNPVRYGGWGALELCLRYSTIDLNAGGLTGGVMNTTSAGVNWWPAQQVQVSINYRYITLDRFDTIGKSSGMNFRVMLMLD